jgi:hypothetical protein
MPKHRRGVLTPYGAATPLCPPGYSGTGPSAALGLLDVAQGYAFTCASLGGLAGQREEVAASVAARLGAPPSIWPRGACNAARPTWADLP